MVAQPPLKDPTSAQQQSHVKAVLAAFQAHNNASVSSGGGGAGGFGGSSVAGSGAVNSALLKGSTSSGKSGGKSGKGKNAGNQALQSPQTAAAKGPQIRRKSSSQCTGLGIPMATSDESLASRVPRARSEWYDVVQGPHWEVPIVFIRQLPELDRGDDDTSAANFQTSQRGTVDINVQVNRALQIIADELGMESIGPEIVVVLAIRDARAMTSFVGHQSSLDTRLVVQLLDSPRPGGTAEGALRAGSRGRGGASSKRAPAAVVLDSTGAVVPQPPAPNSFEAWIDRQQRERSMAVVDGPARAAHVLGPICLRTTIDEVSDDRTGVVTAWAECCVRTVLPTMRQVVHSVAGYGEFVSSKPLLQYPIFPTAVPKVAAATTTVGPEDSFIAGLLTPHAVDSAVGATPIATQSTVAASTRRSKAPGAVHSVSVPHSPTGAAATPMFPTVLTMSTASIVQGLFGKRGDMMRLTSFPPTNVSFDDVEWSEYVRKRNVRGHFTCISAVRALAAQVAVTMAQRQQDIMAQPYDMDAKKTFRVKEAVEEGKEKMKVDAERENDMENKGEIFNEAVEGRGESESSPLIMTKTYLPSAFIQHAETDSNAIRRALRNYASECTTPIPDTNSHSDVFAVDTFEDMLRKSLSSAPIIPLSTQTATADLYPSVEKGTGRTTPGFAKSIIQQRDHVRNRLKAPPFPEDVRWITQQIVKKGLGASVPSPAEMALDLDYLVPNDTDDFSFSFDSERLRAVMCMRELLEQPLNGLSVEADEEAIDRQMLALVEEAFAREFVETTKTAQTTPTAMSMAVFSGTWTHGGSKIKGAPSIAPSLSDLLGDMSLTDMMPLEDRLQQSIERGLTIREREHILYQIFLERAVAAVGMSGTVESDASSTITGFPTTLSRPIEEYVTKSVAVRRMYEFQSRFGGHMCRLLRRVVPDVMEALGLTASYTNRAENIKPKKRVIAIMSVGVPIPPGRRARRLWCHLVSGIPSLDQFSELAAAETLRDAGEGLTGTGSSNFGGGRRASFALFGTDTPAPETARRPNVPLEDFIRRQLLQRLRDSRQFVLPAARQEDGTARPSGAQTILEGRHALYPYCNAVVEVNTTDRGRTCRYTHSSELCCVLHYSIAPPPPAHSSSAQPQGSSAATHPSAPLSPAANNVNNASNGNTGNSGAEVSSPLTAIPAPVHRDETIYLTASFDDGVTLTCTRRLIADPNPSAEEKAAAEAAAAAAVINANNSSRRNSAMRSGARSRRGGPVWSRSGTSSGADDENTVPMRRTTSRRKGRARGGGAGGDDETGVNAASLNPRGDQTRWPFAVATDGSVLLWPTAAQRRQSTGNTLPNALRGMVGYDVTLSAGGITVHAEERSSILWISRHEASAYPAPELLSCVHAMDGPNTRMRTSMEVEVRRAVMQCSGTVCRFFRSGSTQTLYANGAVLTRFPCVRVGSVSSVWNVSSTVSSVCETLVTVNGQCFAREVSLSNVRDEPSRFLRLATTMHRNEAYDRVHHCQTLSRADGVTIVRYLCRNMNAVNQTTQTQNTNPIDPSLKISEVARVVLHVDGTSITTLASDDVWQFEKKQKDQTIHMHTTNHHNGHSNTGAPENDMTHVPPPLRPLILQTAIVTAACGSGVQYCVEAPSLPRLFLCPEKTETPTKPPDENNTSTKAQATLSKVDKGVLAETSNPENSLRDPRRSCSNLSFSCAITPTFAVPVLSPTTSDAQITMPAVPFSTMSDIALPASVAVNSLRNGRCDRFYMAFADGSVLCRRVVLRGTRSTPFLETLLTRTTETSVRVVHDAGLIVVEPADAVRHNACALSSLAIGEGFPMFDLALGGFRLVDHQHHVTEVGDLYSPGAVRATIVPTSLQSLLRELVPPSYTPCRIPRARQMALCAEEAVSEAQYLRDRSMGIYPPLLRRLREFAEGFIIEHRLLCVDVTLATARTPEGSAAMRVGGPVTPAAASTACWGAAHLTRLVHNQEKTQPPLSKEVPSGASEGKNGKTKGSQGSMRAGESRVSLTAPLDEIPTLEQSDMAMAPPGGVAPLLFSELEGGLAVQYLQDRDVDDFLCAVDGDLLPVFLTHSVATGEPGVQQLTLFHIVPANANTTASASIPAQGLSRAPSPFSISCIRTEKDGHTGTAGYAVAGGSFLSEAVRRQERLSAFAGSCVAFRTCAWLPPALQPPRRHLDPRVCRAGAVSPSDSSNSRMICGGQPLPALNEVPEAGSALPTTYERLRVFLRFSDVTWAARQAVVQRETHRSQQLESFVVYQNTALQSSQRIEKKKQSGMCRYEGSSAPL